jgi:hypothetical protein
MYNRYIPQSDGSYSRKSIQNHQQPPRKADPPPVQEPKPDIPPPSPPKPSPVPGFLRQLLPKDFDTGDLLIVLLLLLMAGDCEEEKSNALLTLALYFFM